MDNMLKHPSTTKSDLGVDCISRAEVNQVIEDYMDEQYHVLSDRTRERAFGAKAVMARINELPSVTLQEPKTGHWVKYGIPRCGEQHYKCTNCDEYFNFGLYSDYYKKAFRYCPNCGARMIEPQESEG